MSPSVRSPRRAGVLVSLLAIVLLSALALSGPAAALIRDVEISPVDVADGQLRILPAVSIDDDVRRGSASTAWPVAIINGGDATVTVELAVRFTSSTGNGVQPGVLEVPWATLPRHTVQLRAGQRADLTAVLAPPPAALPAVVSLVATVLGDSPLDVVATRVLTDGTTPVISLAIEPDKVEVSTDATPAIVDLSIADNSGQTVDVGPLVLLPNTTRATPFSTSPGLFGSETVAVAAIDGVEVARERVAVKPNISRLALTATATLLILVTLALTLKRRRT